MQRAQFEALGLSVDPVAGPVVDGISVVSGVHPVANDGPAIDDRGRADAVLDRERENAVLRLRVRELERVIEQLRANPPAFAPVEPPGRLTVPATER